MRKKSTRLLSAALAACMMLSVLPVGAFAAEPGAEEQENGASAQADPVDSESVEINNTNFPDSVFRKYVEDNIDTADTTGQKDGKLSKAERDAVTEINIDKKNCTDLTGIAYFANLKKLYCNDNKLKELNLENNKNLKVLNCSYNNLTTLDVSHNVWLDTLECTNNGMKKLNLGDSQLEGLFCSDNNLTELDVSKNKYLQRLNCQNNKLRRLVIGSPVYRLGMMLYLQGNQLTSLDLHGKGQIWNFDVDSQSYAIDVNEDGTFDLSSLPEGFDASKTTNWKGGTRDENTLNVNSHEVKYEYNTGSSYYRQDTMRVILKVNGHKYQWQHDDAKHWRTCALEGCSGLTSAQRAEAPHDYTDATDPYCDTCGYVRSMHSVITGENVTAELEDKVLNVPVAADTKVHLTATVPEGKRFTGWTVKVGGEEKEADTFLTADANDPTKATFTMPSENVEVTANFASNPTLNPTLRVGDHVTATIDGSDTPVPSGSAVLKNTTVHLTATAPEGQHFTGWTVKVGDEEQKADTFLKTPDENDPTKVTFTMPDKNVEVKATFGDDPIPEPDPVGPSDTGNIQGAISAVVIGAAAGVIAYEAGTGIYRVINMPGIPMPSNRIELAELLWEHAGKPEPVSTALYSDIDEGDTDAQKAARWAVEQDLMKDDADNNKFNPYFPVSKLRTCLTWNAAKEKGLFDKTEE